MDAEWVLLGTVHGELDDGATIRFDSLFLARKEIPEGCITESDGVKLLRVHYYKGNGSAECDVDLQPGVKYILYLTQSELFPCPAFARTGEHSSAVSTSVFDRMKRQADGPFNCKYFK